MLFSMMHTHVTWLSFSRLVSIRFCELPLTYFHRLPERKLLSCGVFEDQQPETLHALLNMTSIFTEIIMIWQDLRWFFGVGIVKLLYKSTINKVIYATRVISESNGNEPANQRRIIAQTRDPNQLKLRRLRFPPQIRVLWLPTVGKFATALRSGR